MDVPEDASKLDIVKAAGIVGMGGAGFPTGIKLGYGLERRLRFLVNAAECEPGLFHNVRQLEEKTDMTISRLEVLYGDFQRGQSDIIAIKAKNETSSRIA